MEAETETESSITENDRCNQHIACMRACVDRALRTGRVFCLFVWFFVCSPGFSTCKKKDSSLRYAVERSEGRRPRMNHPAPHVDQDVAVPCIPLFQLLPDSQVPGAAAELP